ncbi:hypothetical protein DICVIV_04877 [Dictyocaulus viviparus]|uniref:Uncharacterized protein n=1 Tax=Dictyocaulus viviparus TaxID=29172 RepID=A0A0D8XWF6_DICVI|nr:hypothetical protein DICVIV_04877 [Dictyocaulus viviparus]
MALLTATQPRIPLLFRKSWNSHDVYGVANPAVNVAVSADVSTSHCVQFRHAIKTERTHERYSQPATKGGLGGNNELSVRASAPMQMGRALPQLPADMYSVIDKGQKTNVTFADEGGNPMYESIDPENDLNIDPLYSKVGDLTSVRQERKYDYPIFSGRKISVNPISHDDMVYQSASQIYTIGGSEDPYSSITFEPRRTCRGADRDEDSSVIYDPGYARVKPEVSKSSQYSLCMERTEREVDQLYSKIRRPPLDFRDEMKPIPGPSRVTMDEIMEGGLEPDNGDVESVSSREPSYRYITVRENADVVRERLRQQGQLTPSIREHYYSVIGNEYETVGDALSSTYGAVLLPRDQGINSLNVSTTLVQDDFVPPPPTSPIPERMPIRENTKITYISSTSHSSKCRSPACDVSLEPKASLSFECSSSLANSFNNGCLCEGVEPNSSDSTMRRNWNTASLNTATSFAGLDPIYPLSASHPLSSCVANTSIARNKDRSSEDGRNSQKPAEKLNSFALRRGNIGANSNSIFRYERVESNNFKIFCDKISLITPIWQLGDADENGDR